MKIKSLIRNIIKRSPQQLVLVLSGGGARGAIHLGVLQAFDDNNIKIDAISGTSIGAIVGALYCSGLSPKEIADLMKSHRFANVFRLSWNRKGLLAMTKLRRAFTELVPINDFNSLKIPFYCCISNLDTGQFEIKNSGDLQSSVMASASIPILFEPVEINSFHYVDGGLLNNLPVEPFINQSYKIVGVHVNNYKYHGASSIRSISERIFTLVSQKSTAINLKKCDVIIEPKLEKVYRVLDFRNTDELFKIGYDETLKYISQLKQN